MFFVLYFTCFELVYCLFKSVLVVLVASSVLVHVLYCTGAVLGIKGPICYGTYKYSATVQLSCTVTYDVRPFVRIRGTRHPSYDD
jgi:hypothetical protein